MVGLPGPPDGLDEGFRIHRRHRLGIVDAEARPDINGIPAIAEPFDPRLEPRLLVDYRPARGFNENRQVLHLRSLLCDHQIMRFIGQWQDQADKIRFL